MEELYSMLATSAESSRVHMRSRLAAEYAGTARMTPAKSSELDPAETIQLCPSRWTASTGALVSDDDGVRSATIASVSCCMPFFNDVKIDAGALSEPSAILPRKASMARPSLP